MNIGKDSTLSNAQVLEIPYKGHRLFWEREENSTVGTDTRPDNDFHYLAERKDGTVVLYRQMYECPHCGKIFRLTDAIFLPHHTDYEIQWHNRILLEVPPYGFPEPDADRLFAFVTPPSAGVTIGCAHCGFSAKASNAIMRYTLRSDATKTVITQRMEPKDVTPVPVRREKGYQRKRFPIFLELTFNHETGRTFWRETEDEPAAEREATFVKSPLDEYAMKIQINSDTPLRNALIDIFREKAGNFPFSPDEVTLEKLILFNLFLGFPRSFYDAIPFCDSGVEPDFLETAKRLHHIQNLESAFRMSRLPEPPELKQVVYANPALLFYANEILMLPFSIENLIRVLHSPYIYSLLAAIHRMPGIATFLLRLAAARGEVAVLQFILQLEGHGLVHRLKTIAGTVLLFSDAKQKQFFTGISHYMPERKCSGAKGMEPLAEELASGDTNYLFLTKPQIQNCMIESYHFQLLCNVEESRRVLKNLCMGMTPWGALLPTSDISTDYFAVGIRQEQLYIAVLVCANGKIRRIYQVDQKPLEKNMPLLRAIDSWAKQQGISVDYERVKTNSEYIGKHNESY